MNKKTLTLEEAEEMFRNLRKTFYLDIDPDGSSAQLLDSDDLFVSKEDWLKMRQQIDAFFAYIESPDYIGFATLEQINQTRVETAIGVLRRKVGIKP